MPGPAGAAPRTEARALANAVRGAARSFLHAHPVVAGLLALSLGLLLAHAWHYRFLTDDAFISFRYARNLAEGHGLVFNPGFERVEGYTNLLWVLILAGAHGLRVPIEHAANALSLLATAGLWTIVVRETLRRPPESSRAWLVLVPAFALAITRSVAVWSTSGLETRLFELLVVAAAFRLLRELEALERGEAPRPWAALLFGLAEWTRPDGLLVAFGAFVAAAALLAARRRFQARRFLVWIAPCVILIAAHFAFRLAYYGELLPNTYYTKVDGRLWWDAGARYLAAFLLEYGAWIWLPLVIVGAARLVAEGDRATVTLLAGMLLPHVLYVVAIGGDHFEYRPLDLVFPFAFLLLYHGARSLARSPAGAAACGVWLGVAALGLWNIPFQSARQFPRDYVSGFPGGDQDSPRGREFLSPERDPVTRLPVLRSIAEIHRRLVVWNTFHYVAVRQEEHRAFLESVRPVGGMLRRLVEEGRLPRDFHLAMPCVGVIPYDSELRTLDRIGLTDAHVAHSPFLRRLRLAHDKSASDEYLRSRAVDLTVEVRPVCDVTSPDFLGPLRRTLELGEPFVAAEVEPGLYLVGRPPLGAAHLARRAPRAGFQPMNDSVFFERYVDEGIAAYRERLRRAPADDDSRAQLALLLGRRDRYAEALDLLHQALARAPEDGRLWLRVGWCQARLGKPMEAESAIARAIAVGRAGGDLDVIRHAEAMRASVRDGKPLMPGPAPGPTANLLDEVP